jgi:hypothetical protein
MEVSGELQVLAALPPRKQLPISIILILQIRYFLNKQSPFTHKSSLEFNNINGNKHP